MRQVDQNKLSMWTTVRQRLDAQRDVWIGNKAFARASDALTTAIDSLKGAFDRQAVDSLGVSGDRDALRAEAVQNVLTIANCAKVYATEIRSNELFSALNYSKSLLSGFPLNALATQLRTMVRAAQAVSEPLVEFGVPEDAYEAALDTIRLMEQAHTGVRAAITLRKAVNINLRAILTAGQTALTKMDRLIHLFEGIDAEFVLAYKAARSVVPAGMRHKKAGPDV